MALRRRLPALSTEQARGGTALHQLQEVRTSQWKHRMLPQHTQLCAAQRTGHATQSRPSVCPRGCLRKAWQARTRLLRGHALRAGERATREWSPTTLALLEEETWSIRSHRVPFFILDLT